MSLVHFLSIKLEYKKAVLLMDTSMFIVTNPHTIFSVSYNLIKNQLFKQTRYNGMWYHER